MKRILVIMIALLLALSMISCGRLSQRQVEKMIEDAVEEALEEAEEKGKDEDKDEEKDEDEEKEEDKDNNKDTGDGSALYSYDYIGEEIPGDFPSKVVPLYEGKDATVVAAIKTTAGGSTSFTVGIGTNHDVEEVIEAVEKALRKMYKDDEMQKVSTGDSAMFVVASGKEWAFTITVGDGQDENFKTLIGYSVVSK